MIICICRNISEEEICKSIENGNTTIEELQVELGVCVQCESCRYQIDELLLSSVEKI